MKNKLPVSKKPVPVRIVHDQPNEVPRSEGPDKWKIQDALRTIKDAEKFKADKSLMKGVKALAREEARALAKIK